MPIKDMVEREIEIARGGPQGSQDPYAFSRLPGYISTLVSPFKKYFPSMTPTGANPLSPKPAEAATGTPPELAVSHAPELAVSHTPEAITAPPDPEQVSSDVKAFNDAMKDVNQILGGSSPVGELKIPEHSVELTTLMQDARTKLTEWDATLKTALANVDEKRKAADQDTAKIYDEMKKGLLELRQTLMSETFAPGLPPKPPEIQSTEKNLGMMAAIIPGIMAIAAILSGGQSGVNFADMYNGMVDAWRVRDYDQFIKSSKSFDQELATFQVGEENRFRAHQDAFNRAIRGVDISIELGNLELKKIREPLEQAQRALELTATARSIFKDMFETADKAETKDYMNRLKEYELNFNKNLAEKSLKLEKAKLRLDMATKALEVPSKIEERLATSEMRRAMGRLYEAKGTGEELKSTEQRKMFIRSFQIPSGEKVDEATWREDPVHGLTVMTKSGKVFGEK